MRASLTRPSSFRLAAQAGVLPAVALGVFIVWQLVFLVLANLFEFFPHRVHRLDEMNYYRELPAGSKTPYPMVHALAEVTDRWAQLTGQYQIWWLFAPDVPAQATFPVVELHWDDSDEELTPIRLTSAAEPADTANYFHQLTAADRLLYYEANLCVGYAYWIDSPLAADADGWQKLQFDLVASQWKSMRAYMRWQMNQFLEQRPDLPPPSEVRLLVRSYPTPAADAAPASRGPPSDRPVARWRCAESGSGNWLPVEAYDPCSDCFVRLRIPPGRPLEAQIDHPYE